MSANSELNVTRKASRKADHPLVLLSTGVNRRFTDAASVRRPSCLVLTRRGNTEGDPAVPDQPASSAKPRHSTQRARSRKKLSCISQEHLVKSPEHHVFSLKSNLCKGLQFSPPNLNFGSFVKFLALRLPVSSPDASPVANSYYEAIHFSNLELSVAADRPLVWFRVFAHSAPHRLRFEFRGRAFHMFPAPSELPVSSCS